MKGSFQGVNDVMNCSWPAAAPGREGCSASRAAPSEQLLLMAPRWAVDPVRTPSKAARSLPGPFSLGRFMPFGSFAAVLETLDSACLPTGEITINNSSTFPSAYCQNG